MLEVGWSEILVIALILIIVVGPKDLPGMLRNFGRVATRVRGMANEFKGQFDQALREADLDDVRKGIGEVTKLNPTNALRDAMNPIRQFGQDLKSDLQKATDIKSPEAIKVDDMAADPTITPVVENQIAPAAPVAAIPAAAMPVLNTSVVETPKPARKKAEKKVLAAEAAESLAIAAPSKKVAGKKVAASEPVAQISAAEAIPPAVKKAPVRKAAAKASEHAVKVVSVAEPATAGKPAVRKKTTKTGDA